VSKSVPPDLEVRSSTVPVKTIVAGGWLRATAIAVEFSIREGFFNRPRQSRVGHMVRRGLQ